MRSIGKIKIEKRLWRRLVLWMGVLLAGLCLGAAGKTVYAEEHSFEIDAQLRPSDKESMDVLMTIENLGADWEGTVRLTVEGYSCAYDTILSLPQGSVKQFTVRIPKESVGSVSGRVEVSLLDKKNDLTAKKDLGRLLQGGNISLSMGILSDEYTALTYMDMGGSEYYYNGGEYPIKLEQLDKDTLTGMLNALTFLVIDSYNTGILSEAEVQAVEAWVDNGGMLIVGTGSRAGDILSGLDFLAVACDRVLASGEAVKDSFYFDSYIDVSLLSWAELDDTGDLYGSPEYGSAMIVSTRGSGAVGVLPYSLSELGRLGISESGGLEYTVSSMLDDVGEAAASRYTKISSYGVNNSYAFRRMLRFLGNGSMQINFGVLRIIVILYVIFVGPILYLLLRFAKKRDAYWAAVPISALVTIVLVYFAGRGFEVVDARVYSVTIQDLSGSTRAKTYMHCYDSGNKEWSLRLGGQYEYAGRTDNSYYNAADYYIRKEGDRLYCGLDPSAGFEDAYFLAGGALEPVDGSLSGNIDILSLGGSRAGNTVTNGTDFDLAYVAVIAGGSVFVYKDLPAGETRDLSSMKMVSDAVTKSYYDTIDSYMYGCLGGRENQKDTDVLAALGVGIASVYTDQNEYDIILIGVTGNWDKAMDDNCAETSYGCFYAIQ